MTRIPADDPIDERLRQLLAVERGLQERVRNAETDAAERVEAARREAEREETVAHRQQTAADDEHARAERADHELALAALHHQHAAALRAIEGVSDERIDELARRALARAIDAGGGAR